MHPDQLVVRVATVRGLVADQFPQWRALPVQGLSTSGTVNALFRLGDHVVARFPLRSADVETTRMQLESEAESGPRTAGAHEVRHARADRAGCARKRGIHFRGRCRPGCPVSWPPTTTPASRSRLPTTWPSSSAAFARLTRAAGRSARSGAEAILADPTTPGWRPASGTANSSWMYRGSVACGRSCGTCRAARRRGDDARRFDSRQPARVRRSSGRSSSTSAAWDRPTLRSIRRRRGICSRPDRVGCCARTSACDDLEWERGQGLGLRAGDGSRLVLRGQQSGDEPDGPAHPASHHGRVRLTTGQNDSPVRQAISCSVRLLPSRSANQAYFTPPPTSVISATSTPRPSSSARDLLDVVDDQVQSLDGRRGPCRQVRGGRC